MEAVWVLAISLFITLLLGIPIAFALGISVLLSLWAGGVPLTFFGTIVFYVSGFLSYLGHSLVYIVRRLMETGGISQRLIDFVQSFTGHLRSGLGVATVLACSIFAAISGSSPATVAAIGAIMIPAMTSAGYKKETAASISATGGGLGIIIPPSIPMILYAISTDTSVKDMFLAGFGPALVIIVFFNRACRLDFQERRCTYP